MFNSKYYVAKYKENVRWMIIVMTTATSILGLE